MIDAVLLRLMKNRKDFNQLYGVIPKDSKVIDAQTVALLSCFKRYFDDYPSHDRVDLETFLPRFRAWYPKLTPEQYSGYEKVIVNVINVDTDDDQKRNITGWIADVELVTALANIAEAHNNGELADAFSEVQRVSNQYRQRLGIHVTTWITTSIAELLQDELNDAGLRWRLSCLNSSMRGLRPGDFGIIAGRPDRGKTTFLASELPNFAPQLPADQNIVWLNNEGPGKRIIPRLYQSALDLKITELAQLANSGLAEDRYRDIVGRLDRIRVIDIHGMTNGQVQMVLEDNNPGLVVYDMIDNIRGFGDAARTDSRLEEMYKWARDVSVNMGLVGLATSQISNEGDNLMYPPMGALKDSKTGKQGACDFQLMIGSVSDDAFQNSRFISLPKNKLRRADGPGDPKCEVVYDSVRGRYRDMPIGAPSRPEPAQETTEHESAPEGTASNLDELLQGVIN